MATWRTAAQGEKLCSEPEEWSKRSARESKWCSNHIILPVNPAAFPWRAGSLQARNPLLVLVPSYKGGNYKQLSSWHLGQSFPKVLVCSPLILSCSVCPRCVHWSPGWGAEFALQGWGLIPSLICSDSREAGRGSILGVFKLSHGLWESCLEISKPVLSLQQSLQQSSRGRLWHTGACVWCGAVEANDPRSTIPDFLHLRGLAPWSPLSRQD